MTGSVDHMHRNLSVRTLRRRRDAGETLVEVLLTIVIIGLTVTALLSSLAAAGNAGNLQRSSVQGDYILRNYATVAKAAAQLCTAGGTYAPSYTAALPPGFTVGPVAPVLCPNVSSYLPVTLTVAGPLGYDDSLDVLVRTP